jgi:hypothetical protein
MRKGLLLFSFLLVGMTGYGQAIQDTVKGSVTFKTSQNIYVKFESTKDISIGDTLYSNHQGTLQPVLIVHQLSTTSCVGSPIDTTVIQVADLIFSLQEKQVPEETAQPSPIFDAVVKAEQNEAPVATEKPTVGPATKTAPAFRGRISAASYINFANEAGYDVQRMRYTFTLNSREPLEKGFSAETYMSFRHTINEWQDVKDNFTKGHENL